MSAPSLTLPPARPGDAAPRGRVLLGLGTGVLLAHLSLLSGGLSGLSLDLFAAPDAELSGAPPAPAQATPPGTADATPLQELPEPVRASRVRWIVPKAPEPEPEPPPKVVKKAPPPKPEPKPVVIEPVVEAPPVEVAVVPPPEPVLEPQAAPVVEPQLPVSDLPIGTQVAAGTVKASGVGVADAGLPPANVPPSVQLKYAVTALSKGSTYNGSGQLDWKHDGQTYQAQLTAKVLIFKVMSQTSEGQLSGKGLTPDKFTDSRRGERAAHFERSSGKVRYSNNAPDAVLLPGMQDRLSVFFQLSSLFAARPDAYSEGQNLRLPVSSVDASEVWLFQVGQQVAERLPAGEIPTLKLTRSPRKEYDRKVEVWLAPAIAHLPVRLRITEQNGDFVDMKLDEIPALLLPGSTATIN